MKVLNMLMMGLISANQNSVNTNEGLDNAYEELEYTYDEFG